MMRFPKAERFVSPALFMLFVFGPMVLGQSPLQAEEASEAPYHHMHLTTTSIPDAVAWYSEYMGGTVAEGGGRLSFGDTAFVFFEKPAGFAGSAGSGVDHIGFSFPDLESKMKDFEAAGIEILSEVRDVQGLFKFAFIEDPWGTKIEVMEDKELLGFHHIHLRSTDPEATFDWYEKAFGGRRASYKDLLPALRYGDLWLLVQDSKGEEPPATKDRAIDHLGWAFADLEAAAVELKSKGVEFTLEPMPYRDLKIAFVEGPHGVRIELVQPAAE